MSMLRRGLKDTVARKTTTAIYGYPLARSLGLYLLDCRCQGCDKHDQFEAREGSHKPKSALARSAY